MKPSIKNIKTHRKSKNFSKFENNGLIKLEISSSHLNKSKFTTYILGPKKFNSAFFPIEHINSYTSYSLVFIL